MPWKPEVVLPEIGDVFSARTPQSFVIWTALGANPLRKIGPIQPWITETSDDLLAVVGAAVSHHPGLKAAVGLVAERCESALERVTAVIGSDNHRDFWHRVGIFEIEQ